jgi:hypothetical protein
MKSFKRIPSGVYSVRVDTNCFENRVRSIGVWLDVVLAHQSQSRECFFDAIRAAKRFNDGSKVTFP